MTKAFAFAAASALALSFGSIIAQPVMAQTISRSAIVAADHSMRSSKLIGMEVYNQQGMKLGKVEDVLVKASASEPLVVLSVGEFTGVPDKMVAVPLSHINLKSDKASMAATKTQLAAMPTWEFRGLGGGGG